MTKFVDHYQAPIGKLSILFDDDELIRLSYQFKTPYKKSSSANSKRVIEQLQNYFEDCAFIFDIPFITYGTPHQEKVWKALQGIPVGKTKTYSQLAASIGSAPRAIGNACRENPLPIIIPCHRIVAKDHIGGYAGETEGPIVNIKEWLLKHERNQ